MIGIYLPISQYAGDFYSVRSAGWKSSHPRKAERRSCSISRKTQWNDTTCTGRTIQWLSSFVGSSDRLASERPEHVHGDRSGLSDDERRKLKKLGYL